MKALALWQPWAAAVALGWKPLENRKWVTQHRGTLAITAAKRLVNPADVEACINMRMRSLPTLGNPEYRAERERQHAELAKAMASTGCVVAVVNLTQVLKYPELTDAQRIWSAGPEHVGFILCDVRRLAKPVPCIGRQQVFTLDDEVEKLVRASLSSGA